MSYEETPREKYFSIVIPFFNGSIDELLLGLVKASKEFESYEILIVNDGSTSNLEISRDLFPEDFLDNVKIFHQDQSGPGVARNTGVEMASGEYIIFLDADDYLEEGSLQCLAEDIRRKNQPDVLFFDFSRAETQDQLIRRDHNNFRSLEDLRSAILNWEMYQECMFAAYSRNFLVRNGLYFKPGYFEDILFGIKVIFKLSTYDFLEEKIYVKKKKDNSITQTISLRHLQDFIGALESIDNWARREKLDLNWQAALVSRVIWILKLGLDMKSTRQWIVKYIELLDESYLKDWRLRPSSKSVLSTKIGKMYKLLSGIDLRDENSIDEKLSFLTEILLSSWSCIDLHSSVYMAPDEVRTCCKRFFRKGKMAGDVVLDVRPNFKREEEKPFISLEEVWRAKRDLHRNINLGKETDCQDCPFLEFKNWGSLEESFKINYLSMEQHSVCNLRCTYCDEKYYGGALPNYSISKSLDDFAQRGAFSSLSTVVWGGGEPTLDRNFESMLTKLVQIAPNCEHRFLSNSLRFSKAIAQTLSLRKSQLITSIDAGDEDEYKIVRGRKGFHKVLENLRTYLRVEGSIVTIKYIFTDQNRSKQSIRNFVNAIREFSLQEAFFQISWDFKREKVSSKDFLSVLDLFSSLYEIGAKFIFLDDLLLLRMISFTESIEDWRILMQESGISDNFLAKKQDYARISLFGAGQQAIQVQKKTNILGKWPIAEVVESTETCGKEFFGHSVGKLSGLVSDNSSIYILGVQSAPLMYREVERNGIETSRIIRKLLL